MEIQELIKRECLRRGLSIRTIKTYNQCIKQFFRYCRKDPKKVTKEDIKHYLDMLLDKKLAGNTLNVNLCSLKFLYNEILNKRLMINIKFSKKPKTMPTVLTKEEVIRLLNAIENPKHKLMIKLLYSAGLRINELIHLKPKHFELTKNYGWVRKGKGNKDRLFIIAKNLKEELMQYISKECPNPGSWLFLGKKQSNISPMTVQNIIKKAAKKAKITKNVHPHTLRHSFATHLIENNYDIPSVQSLLGHQSQESTMTYLHMASPRIISVESPYDALT